MFFYTKIDGLLTGAVAGTWKTLVALKFAATTGHRGRLRRMIVSGGGGATQDVQASIQIRRSDNTGDGTSTAVNVNTIAKRDPNPGGVGCRRNRKELQRCGRADEHRRRDPWRSVDQL